MTAGPAVSEHPCQHRTRGSGRQWRGERAQVGFARVDQRAEIAALRTPTQVSTHPTAAQHTTISIGDRPANRLTLHHAPLGELV
jgi:hypothetical protein